MARRVRDAFLDSRNARRKLKQRHDPHWRSLDKGLHLGYRRGFTGGSWIARRFNDAGKYSKQFLGYADDQQDADGVKVLSYDQAQQAARDWLKSENRKEAGLEEVQTGHYTISDAMKDYLANYAIEGKGLSVMTAIANGRILPDLGHIQVERLTTKKIKDWFQALAEAPARLRTSKAAAQFNLREDGSDPDYIRRRRATANRVMTVLKAALNYAWREGKVANDTAWRKVKPFKNTSAPVIRYLSPEECVRLVNACQADMRRMVQGGLFTGCRYGELANLKVHDYDAEARTVLVRTSKSGKSRHVNLTNEAKDFFDDMVAGKDRHDLIFTRNAGGQWGKSHQHRTLKETCARAKIEPAISFHILRHTHGSLLAMKGVPMPVIAKQLGHADTRMTEKHYAHVSPSYVADTIRQNFPVLGIATKSNIVPMKLNKADWIQEDGEKDKTGRAY